MAHTHITGHNHATTLFTQRIIEAMQAKHGVFVLDPRGAITDTIIHHIPKSRIKDTTVFDPSREEVVCFNPLEDQTNVSLSASVLADTIKDAWGYAGETTPVLDMYLYFSLAALIATDHTLAELPKILTDRKFRDTVRERLSDSYLLSFWQSFETMTDKEKREEVRSTLNKALMLVADKRVRSTLGCFRSKFHMKDIVQGQILLAKVPLRQLSKGRSKTLSAVLVSLLYQACLARKTDQPFEVFIADCHLLPGALLSDLLSTVGEYNVRVTILHQNIDQLDTSIYNTIIANCPEQIIFRTSSADAQKLYDRLDRDQKMTTRFDQLADGVYRYAPFWNAHYATVEDLPIPTYKHSQRDVEARHRLTLWGKGAV